MQKFKQAATAIIVGFNYPDNGGTVYLGANSDAGWVYLEPQTDSITGNITYTVVPSPTTGTVPFETGLESDEFGQVAVTLPIEIGIGMLILGETLPIALTGAAVVEGSLLLGSGIAYIQEQLSPQEGTCDVRPVQVPQGLVMGAGTDYVVTVSNGTTTIQVIDGSVIFVDQYTNSSITVQANQMLMLPSGVPTGFSNLDLQSHISAYDASSINQWWIPIATATPMIVTASPTNLGNERQHESSVSTYVFRASYYGNSLCGSRDIPFCTKKTNYRKPHMSSKNATIKTVCNKSRMSPRNQQRKPPKQYLRRLTN